MAVSGAELLIKVCKVYKVRKVSRSRKRDCLYDETSEVSDIRFLIQED